MKKTHISLTLFILFGLVFNNIALSWDDKVTHKDLSTFAAENSVLSQAQGDYLITLGFNKGLDEPLTWNGISHNIRLWFQEGAQLEDKSSTLFPILGTTRSLNHFHNPLKPWSQAGLDDWYIGHWTGESSLVWAQDGNAQQNIVEGDWSWQKTRSYYSTAVTSTTDSARQENFAKTFRGLGHQMHLLQDTAVPDHVRNDAHPEDAIFGKSLSGTAYFESWARDKSGIINAFAASPIYPDVAFNVSHNGYAPATQLFDAEIYNGTNPSTSLAQGLSEYTNANFFSNDTIFAAEIYQTDDGHYFPYPKKTSTDLQSFMSGSKAYETITAEDGTTDNGYWISKTSDGETINHFLRAGYFTDIVYNAFGEGSLYHETFYRDEKCHEDYVAKLIPRAVGYSAGLLDYFFRGTIDITVPSNGVYSMIDATQPGFDPETTDFTSIKLRAKNTTVNNEEMTNGTIQLVVKYKKALADPFQSGPVETDTEFSYIVVPEKNGVSSLSRSAYTELNFDLLGENAISLWATDVYLQVVYKGTLGNEENAVAVGFKDISEPTPIDIFNNMDKICINGSWYEAGSPEAIAQVDSNHDGIANEADVYAYDLQNLYLRFSPYSESSPYYFASPSAYNIAIPYLYSGTPIRAAYLLDDYMFNKGYYMSFVKLEPSDPWTRPVLNQLWWHSAVKRQTDYSEDDELCEGNPPCNVDVYPVSSTSFPSDYISGFYTFRNTTMWWGSVKIVINNPYPSNSVCSMDSL